MPGLLDLPPEPIEQIFAKCEETAYEEWCAKDDEEDYWAPRPGVPAFRSTCRYIKRATCRRLAEVYLGDGLWKIAAMDADIKKCESTGDTLEHDVLGTRVHRRCTPPQRLQKRSRPDFVGLANGPCELGTFTMGFGGLFMGEDEEVIFPSSQHKPDVFPLDSFGEIEGEEEWIEVVIQPYFHWKGKENVKWALREMAAHVQSL